MQRPNITPVVIFISLLYSTCNSATSDSWCVSNTGNQTIIPHTNPNTVFQTYGYRDAGIPRDLSMAKANLLHEESVLHVMGPTSRFKMHNSGSFAKLYEAVMRWSGENVLVKRLNVGNFDNVLNEAVIMSYLSHNPHVPMLYGLLPSGPNYDDVALVVELIRNSSNLYELVAKETLVTECQWMDISLQIASVLLDVHEHYVLFNDLHESNIVIQWRGSNPFVYVVDYGQAAFRHGESFADTPEEDRLQSNFMGPEVWYDITSPASDVYSLGDMLLVISKYVKHRPFHDLAHKCHQEIVKNRIKLSVAKHILTNIVDQHCQGAKASKADDVVNKENDDERIRNGSLTFTSRIKKEKPLMSPLPVISWEYLNINESLGQWVNSDEQVSYRTASYPLINSKVVIKEFNDEDFIGIRYEAIINSIMNDTGYVLAFQGLVPMETQIAQFCIMQEYIEGVENLWDAFDKITNESINYKILLAVEVSKAVSTFHQKSIVINDIKPENILLIAKDKIPKIKFIDLRKCTGINESPFWDLDDDYLCPSIKMVDRVTYASDVYSLGILLRNVFTSCSDFSITEMIHRAARPNPLTRPSAQEFQEFFENKI